MVTVEKTYYAVLGAECFSDGIARKVRSYYAYDKISVIRFIASKIGDERTMPPRYFH